MAVSTLNQIFDRSANELKLLYSKRMAPALRRFFEKPTIDVVASLSPLAGFIRQQMAASPRVLSSTLIPVEYRIKKQTLAEFGDPRGTFKYGGEKETKTAVAYTWSYIKWRIRFSEVDTYETDAGERLVTDKIEELLTSITDLMNEAFLQGDPDSNEWKPYGVEKFVAGVGGFNDTIADVTRKTSSNEGEWFMNLASENISVAPGYKMLNAVRALYLQSRQYKSAGGTRFLAFARANIINDLISFFEMNKLSVQYEDTLNIGWSGVKLPFGIEMYQEPNISDTNSNKIYLLSDKSFEFAEDARVRLSNVEKAINWIDNPDELVKDAKGIIRFYFIPLNPKASGIVGNINDLTITS